MRAFQRFQVAALLCQFLVGVLSGPCTMFQVVEKCNNLGIIAVIECLAFITHKQIKSSISNDVKMPIGCNTPILTGQSTTEYIIEALMTPLSGPSHNILSYYDQDVGYMR